MMRSNGNLYMVEYIKNVLYFATTRQDKELKSTNEVHYFSIDNELVYENYYSDFGPLNLGCVYKYCNLLNDKLKYYLNKQTIVHYTSIDPKKKANAAFLLGCFGVLYLSLSPKDAMKPLLARGMTYRPFQDATQGDPEFTISIMDCLKAIKKASDLGFFNFKDFNYEEYDRLDKIAGGDLNWIIPGKFLAFIGPVDFSVSLYHPPEMYIDYFKENNVEVVIRLNKRLYDAKVFDNAGIKHYDLYFDDGSCPPRIILFKFLQISEDTQGALAVHCKAGLGRTGSLIGSYLIKHYRMTACEAIGWMRICRPGSVIGHQQAWLEQLEVYLTKQGNIYRYSREFNATCCMRTLHFLIKDSNLAQLFLRKKRFNDPDKLPTHPFGVYSIAEKASRRRPVVFQKVPPPPPPIQRYVPYDKSSPVRPQASKIREAPIKMEKDWFLKNSKTDCKRYNMETRNSGRRSGAGEPRPSRGGSSCGSTNTTRSITRENSTVLRKLGDSGSRPAARASDGPLLKTVNDAKSFLMKSSTYKNDRVNHLNSSITVTPHCPRRPSNTGENRASDTAAHVTPYSFSTATAHGSTQPVQRRRLGRSPSPSPQRSSRVLESSRATNTPPPPRDRALKRDNSRVALREALSRLKLADCRNCSVGASSLGARRDAPAPRAPSVRSDERAVATQGDMLNSIKLQRRYKETLEKEKNNRTYNTFIPKEKITPLRGISGPPRPGSPKGRSFGQKNLP